MEKKEAMKILKEFHDKSALFSVRTALDAVIPELKESEDERIRKALLEMVHDTTGNELWIDYNVHKEDAIAYLEKQCETFTQEDVDDAYLKGISNAKNELEKQCTQKPIISNNALREGIWNFGLTQYQIDNWLKKYVDVEKQGEQNNQHLYDIIIALWDLLDKIDTFSDLQIDDTNPDNPFRKIEDITQERHKFVKSDGYDLFIENFMITNDKNSENQGKHKETLCDKCKREQPSRSCQDITELGRCAVEHEQNIADKE